MISLGGIAIFLFGNKIEDGKVVQANGVRREFEIAVEHGLNVVPVGATGCVAGDLWAEVNANLDRFYPGHSKEFQENFKQIGDTTLDSAALLESVLNLLDKIIRR
jgi:hypothetical protein